VRCLYDLCEVPYEDPQETRGEARELGKGFEMKRFLVALVATLTLGLFLVAPAMAGTTGCYAGSCTPGVGHNGRDITGTNWCPNTTVTIFVDGVKVGTADVGADGTFTFTLPASVGPGTHIVVIKGQAPDPNGGCSPATQTITVVLGASGGGTAFTGARGINTAEIAGAALLIVGAGALLAGRRSRRTAIAK
jgi:hypothetical protein